MAHRSLTEKVARALFAAIGPPQLAWEDQRGSARDLFLSMGEIAVDTLGLTEENRTLTDGWIQPSRNAMYYAHGLTPPPAVITNEHRYVTAWEEV